MKDTLKAIVMLLILSSGTVSFGQSSNEEKAYAKGMEAIELMENGDIEKSIKLLEEAKKLDPKNINYPYEIAYAQYLNKDYKAAAKTLEPLTKHKDVNDRVFQLLGNSYSMNNQREKAIDTYEKGLFKFPRSGNLYLERGNMEMFVKDYDKAINYFEKGIEFDPKFPSNYYWATKLYCSSTEEVWGMIYGEIFMNLEPNSKRTAEISKLLFDTYKSEIKLTSDTSMSVSFCQQMTISMSSLSDPNNIKLPFCMIFEPTLMLSIAFEEINITSLNKIRSSFIDNYFDNERDKTYPNALFSFQKKVKDAGHMEAYNHWILMKGEEDGFEKWHSENKEKWDSFVKWFGENALTLSASNKFYRGQY